MSTDLPTKTDLRVGMTVEVQKGDGSRIVGEIGAILSDENSHPEGILVKLKSGVKGRVKAIRPDL